jgi:hypothetical protein
MSTTMWVVLIVVLFVMFGGGGGYYWSRGEVRLSKIPSCPSSRRAHSQSATAAWDG